MESALVVLFSFGPFVLIGCAVVRGIKRYSNKYPPVTHAVPAGVGGWILFVIFGLVFLGPVIGAVRLESEIRTVEKNLPNLQGISAWFLFKSTSWLTFLVTCCLSVYAGIGLVKGRNPSVVKRAKVLLWVIGPLATVVAGLILPFMIFGSMGFNAGSLGALIGGLIVSFIGAMIWTAYLNTSTRVRRTYGK